MGKIKQSRIEQIEKLVLQLEKSKMTREEFEIEKKKILDTSPVNRRNRILFTLFISSALLIGVILFVSVALGVFSNVIKKDNNSSQNITNTPLQISPTISQDRYLTITPTASLTPTNTQIPTPSAFVEPIIPELTAVDVYGNLENKGFTCEKRSMSQAPIYLVWTCKDSASDYDFTVEIFAGNSMQIYAINTTALNFTSKTNTIVSGDFLSFMATLPYKDAKPTEAKDWVKNNIESHDKSTVISNVKFSIYGEAKAKILKINHMDSTLD